MWKNINYENCLSYIKRHAVSEAHVGTKAAASGPGGFAAPEGEIHPSARPSVTISRMCGSGGRTVASELAKYLQSRTPAGRQWTIFDKNLIAKVLEDHHLSRRIGEFLTEDGKSLLTETIEKMRGLHPPTATMVKHTAETIWNLAASGHVILVGRAANVVTEKLDNVYHVRLVGTLESRIARIEEVYEMSRTDALEFIRTQDAAKRRYVRVYFGREIDDPMLYHLIINTDRISYAQAARLIGDAVVNRFKLAAGAGLAAG
jgi:cytidylate kinase